jgi:DNA-binding NtrC family response regulator
VVDDERDIRDTIAEYLDINGFQVSTADGGTALRQLVEQAEIDLVTLVYITPSTEGWADQPNWATPIHLEPQDKGSNTSAAARHQTRRRF